MTNKRIELFFDILALFAAVIYFVVLFLNIDYFKVPHGDIYQYIRDAKNYARLEFPWLIQLHPISPILIAIFQPLFKNFEFPYFGAAKFISILAGSGSFFFTYLIAKEKLSPKIALLASFFCFIHPISILVNLDVTNVSLYLFFSTVALYFLNKNTKKFFIFTTFAFFVRIEGILLLFVYLLSNFLKRKDEGKYFKENIISAIKDKKTILFFLITTFWMSIQTIHNLKNNFPMGNRYLEEIANVPLNLGHFVYIFGLIGTLFFPEKFEWWNFNLLTNDVFTILVSTLSVFFIFIFLIKKSIRNYGFYILLMATTHSLFPFIEIRYFYLLLNIFIICAIITISDLLKEFNNKIALKKILSVLILSTATYYYALFIQRHFETQLLFYRYAGHDLNFDVTEWIEKLPENKIYYLITKEPFLYYGLIENKKYFLQEKTNEKIELKIENNVVKKIEIKNKKINFINPAEIRKECESGTCMLEKNLEKKADYYIITDSIADQYNQDLWIKENGIKLVKELLSKEECLSEEKYFENFHSYRKIFKINSLDCFLEKK